ncbi:MerR family transcriptional regulator [Actinophytocola oryzae]|uniref:MerR-like DNA binding protein n=1 Tax=Actinophytocola oryzae TaxID=502181 RepID=A0A4R7W0H6_9PSEU|nr:MerR family transcriptional regulator [Actinophytocola oryzae]TDV55458.1 MerR-like DNA binding protein [Actinophytocola oryzae]
MRIAELSRRTGVPVATIKYYLREGLVPHGERTSPNQARYDESHLHRVRLVRALVEVGGLPIATAREVLTLMHEPGRGRLESLGKVHFAVQRARQPHAEAPSEESVARVAALVARRGWRARETNPARTALAGVLDHLDRLGEPDALGLLDSYADAAERLAGAEVATLVGSEVDHLAERVVIMTALGGVLLDALRALAQESAATAALES